MRKKLCRNYREQGTYPKTTERRIPNGKKTRNWLYRELAADPIVDQNGVVNVSMKSYKGGAAKSRGGKERRVIAHGKRAANPSTNIKAPGNTQKNHVLRDFSNIIVATSSACNAGGIPRATRKSEHQRGGGVISKKPPIYSSTQKNRINASR